MKLRTQRTHFMGISNRPENDSQSGKKSLLETSYLKSKSCYYKPSIIPSSSQQQNERVRPFNGTNVEHESLRFHATNLKRGRRDSWKLEPVIPQIDHGKLLNGKIKNIKAEFDGRDVNMHKLYQLKHTFIKNNAERRNLKKYFQKFEKNGRVGVDELKKIVKQYGYDITGDEAELMFKINDKGKEKNQKQIDLGGFVQLMTKDNIYFKTLELQKSTNSSFTQEKFNQKVHLVLKNKFNKLKEALRVYQKLQEEVDYNKYKKVMKKMDINDMIIGEDERKGIYDQFKNSEGNLNVEQFLGSIITQENNRSNNDPGFFFKESDVNFKKNLKLKDELLADASQRPTENNFKVMTNLEYDKCYSRANKIVREIKKIYKGNNDILKSLCPEKLPKGELRVKIEEMLQKKGINFNKQHYDNFMGYLEYNNKTVITREKLQHYLIFETQKESYDRFERRTRQLPPTQSAKSSFSNVEQVPLLLQKVKGSGKFNCQGIRNVFKKIDKDCDGYLSRDELKCEIEKVKGINNEEVDNLVEYFDSSNKGYVEFAEFAKKYEGRQDDKKQMFNTSMKIKSQSDWLNSKRTFISHHNSTFHPQVASKYSAWPSHLNTHDMSLIQPPNRAGQSINEQKRFNSTEKHSIGAQYKQQKNRMYENKLRRLAKWNEANEMKVQNISMIEEKRSKANDYSMRLLKENYEDTCHEK